MDFSKIEETREENQKPEDNLVFHYNRGETIFQEKIVNIFAFSSCNVKGACAIINPRCISVSSLSDSGCSTPDTQE